MGDYEDALASPTSSAFHHFSFPRCPAPLVVATSAQSSVKTVRFAEMAPKYGKESLLDLSTSTIAAGNSLAVHLLDYLSVVKSAPQGFEELAITFLETSRVLFPVRIGLLAVAASRNHPPRSVNVDNDLKERLRRCAAAFASLDQLVARYIENEKRHGLGKLGKSFRMMSAGADIEKLRKTLIQCRETLRLSAVAFPSPLPDEHIEATAGIGYTALTAVLMPSESRAASRQSPTPRPHASMSQTTLRQDSPLPNLPQIPRQGFSTDTSDLYSPVSTLPERRSSVGTSLRADSGKGFVTSTRVMSDAVSELTPSEASMAASESLMSVRDLANYLPPQAIRSDSRSAPRFSPKRHPETVPAAARASLASAVQQGDHKVMEQLLDSGVPANGHPDHSLLREAILAHDHDSVRLLLLFGADVNAKDQAGSTPLHTATLASFPEAVQMLLRYGADPNLCSSPSGESALAASLNETRVHFAQLYLKHGASPDTVMENGLTPLTQIMEASTPISIVELLLLHNANPNGKNRRGETALFRAINADRADLVNLLLSHGADPNLPGPKHMLWPAVHKQEILELLLDHGADLRRAPGVLELATSINSLDAVQILLEHGADPNAKKDGIYTPLCSAIRDNRENLVEILLAAGADPNLAALDFPIFKCITYHRAHLLPQVLAAGATPNNPKGAAELAVTHNEIDALNVLLANGVDPNERNAAGHTALTTAIRTNNIPMLELLLANGADPAVRGQEWPIIMAVQHPDILAKLLPHIKPSRINKGALERAVVANQLASIKLLLAAGVSVEDRNGGVFSPLTTSIREDRKEIFRYLLDVAGADPNSPGEHLPIIKAIRRHRGDDLSYISHLLQRGADMNLMYRGWNAVLQALDDGDTAIFRLLAEEGNPDPGAQDENGRTVAEIMQERGMHEELEILLRGGAPSPKIGEAMAELRDLVKER